MKPRIDNRSAFIMFRWLCIKYSITLVTATLDHRRRAAQARHADSQIYIPCGGENILIYLCDNAKECVKDHNNMLYNNGTLAPLYECGEYVSVTHCESAGRITGEIGAVIPMNSDFSEELCIYSKSAFMYLPAHGWRDEQGRLISCRAVGENFLQAIRR